MQMRKLNCNLIFYRIKLNGFLEFKLISHAPTSYLISFNSITLKINYCKNACVASVATRYSYQIFIMNFTIFISIILLVHLSKGQEVDETPKKKVVNIDGSQVLRGLSEKIQACTNETGISEEQRAKIFGNDYSDESKEVKVNLFED